MLEFKNAAILTGAGFTASFGGFLANGMWSKIYNNPHLNSKHKIKGDLRNKFNFEEIYSNIFENSQNYTQEESISFKNAVMDTYIEMNNYLINRGDRFYQANKGSVVQFLNDFLDSNSSIGAYFTLNQDTLPEMEFDWVPFGLKVHTTLQLNKKVILPTDEELVNFMNNPIEANIRYIKLHGSLNWVQRDGNDTMILGINKISVIKSIPLLNWYFNLFNSAINQNGAKLLIIGYGFKDDHINKCLSDAIKNVGLKLYVISPEPPESFKNNLIIKKTHQDYNGMISEYTNYGNDIWNAIEAYFPYKLHDIFPNSGYHTSSYDEVIRAFK